MTRTPATARRRAKRRGVAMIEGAVVLSVTLLFMYAGLEIGLLVTRYNALSEAARCGARCVMVRGEEAAELGPLGVEEMQFTADEDNPVAQACRTMLPTMQASDVLITVTWPDGGNAMGDRVQVTLEYENTFIVSLLSDFGNIPLSARSVMLISR